MAKISVLQCFYAVMVVCTMNTTAKSLKDDNMQLTTTGTIQKGHYLPPAFEEFCDLKDSTDKYEGCPKIPWTGSITFKVSSLTLSNFYTMSDIPLFIRPQISSVYFISFL